MGRCIFCRADSANSRSVEHVVPESLWNSTHILPAGVVCDACNNYFAREVEKPFLDSAAIAQLRFVQAIPNKRGRIPPSKAILSPGFEVTAFRDAKVPYGISLDLSQEAWTHMMKSRSGSLLIPYSDVLPKSRVISRFLAKIALEAMALRLLEHPEGIAYITDEAQLDPIRNFARRGQPHEWPHHARRIYDADRAIFDVDGNSYQTVHEFDFLVTEQQEWYFVFALFGLELTINIGGPEIDGYVAWLKKRGGTSPLYPDKKPKFSSLVGDCG